MPGRQSFGRRVRRHVEKPVTQDEATIAHDGRPSSLPPVGRAARPAAAQRIVAAGENLAPIVWRGQLLTILTLGIYRFWYRTQLRRWYWRNTIVDGDGLEYRGTPRELLIGFLIALAVTLPLYFAGALGALFLASETAGNILTMAGLAVLAVLAQYGAYRSRRFRLSRTLWRGVRFDQKGSAWGYAARSAAWGLAAVATAFLLLPLFRRALESMKIGNTLFGSAEGCFRAPGGHLMAMWFPIWLIVGGLSAGALYWLGVAGGQEDGSLLQEDAAVTGLALAAAAILAFCIGWPAYRASEFRRFAAGSSIGPVSFQSDLSAWALYGIYLRFGLVTIALLAVGAAIALKLIGVALFSIRTAGPDSAPGTVVIAVAAVAYLVGVYVFMSLKELMLNRPFWRSAAGSITVFGLDRVDGIVARPVADEAATGEGLADAIDFGGI
jgi:uncharacterized membrane protein YjgN (DUF898 family)